MRAASRLSRLGHSSCTPRADDFNHAEATVRRTFPALLAIMLACSSTPNGAHPSGVSLSAAPDAAQPGSIALTLHNGADGPITYNLCASSLQRSSGTTWETVPEQRACTLELRTLDPGADATQSIALPAGTSSGEFRYSTSVGLTSPEESVTVASNSFMVGG